MQKNCIITDCFHSNGTDGQDRSGLCARCAETSARPPARLFARNTVLFSGGFFAYHSLMLLRNRGNVHTIVNGDAAPVALVIAITGEKAIHPRLEESAVDQTRNLLLCCVPPVLAEREKATAQTMKQQPFRENA